MIYSNRDLAEALQESPISSNTCLFLRLCLGMFPLTLISTINKEICIKNYLASSGESIFPAETASPALANTFFPQKSPRRRWRAHFYTETASPVVANTFFLQKPLRQRWREHFFHRNSLASGGELTFPVVILSPAAVSTPYSLENIAPDLVIWSVVYNYLFKNKSIVIAIPFC